MTVRERNRRNAIDIFGDAEAGIISFRCKWIREIKFKIEIGRGISIIMIEKMKNAEDGNGNTERETGL